MNKHRFLLVLNMIDDTDKSARSILSRFTAL